MRICAAVLAAGLVGGGRAMNDNTIKAAVELWESDRAAAEAQYGPISAWDTADVVDMEKLFHFSTDFNEDIGAWNTSSVTSMNRMFWYAIDFDQPIGSFAASDSSAPPGAEPAQAPGTSARSRTSNACSATRRCSTKTSVFCGALFVFGLGYEHAIAAIGLSSPIRYRRNSPSTRTLARDQHAIAATVRAEKNTHQHAIAAISDPRRRLARRQRRDHRPHVLRRLGLRPGPRLVHARDRGPGVSHLPVPVERLCFAVSFVSLPLFVLCRGDFAPAPVARSLRPSHPLGTPRRHRRGLTASRTRAGGVLRGVRAEDPGALGACEPEKTPAPTPDPEGRVCNGGPYDGRRCQNHGFCQQPDPTQPDVDACDDCKCITRKDSDGAGRTSSSGCFLAFFLGVLFGVS